MDPDLWSKPDQPGGPGIENLDPTSNLPDGGIWGEDGGGGSGGSDANGNPLGNGAGTQNPLDDPSGFGKGEIPGLGQDKDAMDGVFGNGGIGTGMGARQRAHHQAGDRYALWQWG